MYGSAYSLSTLTNFNLNTSTLNVMLYTTPGQIANSEGPDQTAPQEQSDQGLHCLLRYACPNTKYLNNISTSAVMKDTRVSTNIILKILKIKTKFHQEL